MTIGEHLDRLGVTDSIYTPFDKTLPVDEENFEVVDCRPTVKGDRAICWNHYKDTIATSWIDYRSGGSGNHKFLILSSRNQDLGLEL